MIELKSPVIPCTSILRIHSQIIFPPNMASFSAEVMSALPQMTKLYGSDVSKVEAAAIDVSSLGMTWRAVESLASHGFTGMIPDVVSSPTKQWFMRGVEY